MCTSNALFSISRVKKTNIKQSTLRLIPKKHSSQHQALHTILNVSSILQIKNKLELESIASYFYNSLAGPFSCLMDRTPF